MCSPFRGGADKTIGMIAQIQIEHIIADLSPGRISLRPIGREPIQYEWRLPPGVPQADGPQRCDLTTDTPGRYTVTATDATGAVASASADVRVVLPDAIVLTEYKTTPCSHGAARDGRVEILGHNLGWERWIWSCGVETRLPVLEHAAMGTYTAWPLPAPDGRVPKVISLCGPGQVLSAPL